MSNEELAELIQKGEPEHIPLLWTQVEKFVSMKARQYERHLINSAADIDDLKQSGFFAMLEAIRYFDPNKGIKFCTYLSNTLKNAFAEVAGIRGSKRDMALYSFSLDVPVSVDSEHEDGGNLIDFIEDKQAQAPFRNVIEQDYLSNVNVALLKALEYLSARARHLIILMYFNGLSLCEAADLVGYTSRQAAENVHYNALRKIRCSSTARELRFLLNGLDEFDLESEAINGTGLQLFKDAGESATERAAIRYSQYKQWRERSQ